MVSAGNRPRTSTSAAAGPATRSATAAIRVATDPARVIIDGTVAAAVIVASPGLHLVDGGPDGRDRRER